MLASLAKQFELTEENTTARALRRIWWMMVLSLPAFPMIFWFSLFDHPTNFIALGVFILVFLIASLASTVFLTSRFVNRFYFPDKYLDEWEIRIKHKSIVFAVQVFIVGAIVVLTMAAIFDSWFNVASLSFTALQIGAAALFLIIGFFYVQAFKALSLIEPIEEDEYTDGAGEKRDNRFISLFIGGYVLIGLIISIPLIAPSFDAGSQYGRALANCHNQDMKLDDYDRKTGEFTCKISSKPKIEARD